MLGLLNGHVMFVSHNWQWNTHWQQSEALNTHKNRIVNAFCCVAFCGLHGICCAHLELSSFARWIGSGVQKIGVRMSCYPNRDAARLGSRIFEAVCTDRPCCKRKATVSIVQTQDWMIKLCGAVFVSSLSNRHGHDTLRSGRSLALGGIYPSYRSPVPRIFGHARIPPCGVLWGEDRTWGIERWYSLLPCCLHGGSQFFECCSAVRREDGGPHFSW